MCFGEYGYGNMQALPEQVFSLYDVSPAESEILQLPVDQAVRGYAEQVMDLARRDICKVRIIRFQERVDHDINLMILQISEQALPKRVHDNDFRIRFQTVKLRDYLRHQIGGFQRGAANPKDFLFLTVDFVNLRPQCFFRLTDSLHMLNKTLTGRCQPQWMRLSVKNRISQIFLHALYRHTHGRL